MTTTYTLDLAAGLTQVLADGTHTYLYGNGRIAQHDGSGFEYFLGDALGSVRQLADGSADVTLTRSYEPYGDVLESTGTGTSMFSFTGEQFDSYIKLLFLRARWLNPATGRFLSKDTWRDYSRPLSLNGWSYIDGDPINYTDPTGHYRDPGLGGSRSSSDPRDLTSWLYREMITNINDPRLQSVRQINRAGNVGTGLGMIVIGAGLCTANPLITIGGGGVTIGGGALYEIGRRQFAQLVGDHMVWDFKHRIKSRLGDGITLIGQNDLEYSVPGNIHFGFVAGEAAYAATVVHLGAGHAEITDPAHDPVKAAEADVEYIGPYDPSGKFGWSWDSGFSFMLGDDPLDHAAVNFGLMLYFKYGRNLTQKTFEQELVGALATLAHHAPIPAPVAEQVSRNWPYPVGYFDPTRP